MFGLGNAIATTLRTWVRVFPRIVVVLLACHLPLLGWYALHWIDASEAWLQRNYYRPLLDAHPAVFNGLAGALWFLQALAGAGIALLVVARVRSEPVRLGAALGGALRRIGAVFVAGLIARAATAGVLVLGVVLLTDRNEWYLRGFETYLVWAAIWMVLASLFVPAIPALVVERRGPLSAIARGFALARGNRIKVFAIVLVDQVLSTASGYLVWQLVMADNFERARFELYGVIILALDLLHTSLWAVAAAVIYERLREAKEGPAPGQLHAVFD